VKRDPKKWLTDDLPKIEEFFKGISEKLERFAKKHNLRIEKYLHRRPAWSFFFRHPKGGCAVIMVGKWGDKHVEVIASWWFDEYKELRCSIKDSNRKRVTTETSLLLRTMEDILTTVVSWERADLKPIPHVYHGWKEVGRAKLEKELERYPIPRI
jgi:hypothetical protein